LIMRLSEGLDGTHALSLLRSQRSFTDCRPVSIFSLQTVQQIGEEVGFALDKRRFRANIYADLRQVSPRTRWSVASSKSIGQSYFGNELPPTSSPGNEDPPLLGLLLALGPI